MALPQLVSSDLAEPLLLADLFKLEKGHFHSRKERDRLVRSALQTLGILESEGSFSFGQEKLKEVKLALSGLLVSK